MSRLNSNYTRTPLILKKYFDINPFNSNGLAYRYQWDWPISNLKLVGVIVFITQMLKENSLKGTATLMISIFYQKELYEPLIKI